MGQSTGLLSDAHNVLAIVGLLLMGLLSVIGYKVHAILFNMKLPERLGVIENTVTAHEKRLDKIEARI